MGCFTLANTWAVNYGTGSIDRASKECLDSAHGHFVY